ncbi:MAG TPA: CheR family methyltransferase [Ramlibacter sp.]|jgi:two-component system CheB/CheR fusion protein|nr:CheR family methyltransferase [Ramlibacter sp.]
MSAEPAADGVEEQLADRLDDLVPSYGYRKIPVVGMGGSAGSIESLQAFFQALPPAPGVAFVVVIHLSPSHNSMLTEVLQRCTGMRVVKVEQRLEVQPDTVYVIPQGKILQADGDDLVLTDLPEGHHGPHVVVDILFRSLADSHGAHTAGVVLSGLDGDGSVGIKRIKERGGLTVVQDPDDASHGEMPRSAIGTGMVDWVLPVRDMPARILSYFRLERAVRLPPEEAPAAADTSEAALRDVLNFLRTRTGRDFTHYKRATVLRRIGRRMQVTGVDNLAGYLNCLRTRPGECQALLQDLLISVTNFFRDPHCFAALEAQLPALFEGKGPNDTLRAWVIACATGEEAYSVAMLLADHARTLEAPPVIQVFATDLDEQAVQTAREAVYPGAIIADVSEERLRRHFIKEHRGYRVRRELREMVLFAVHDVLQDAPFSRQDLVSCRNLLIYLGRQAQERVFETMHFSLAPGGRLFLGSSESMDEANTRFNVLDKKHRLYAPRSTARPVLPLPPASSVLTRSLEMQYLARSGPVIASHSLERAPSHRQPHPPAGPGHAGVPWGELHLQLLERLAPPSVLVDAEYDIVHLSPSAGRFLQLSGGEPSRNLLRAVTPDVRIDLRAALYQAMQQDEEVQLPPMTIEVAGGQTVTRIRVVPVQQEGERLCLVLFDLQPDVPATATEGTRLQPDPMARHLDAEIERLKTHLRDTVEQYEASTEELKASNEELQAMNEEMRAATEELETSREELQSINEELTTVNQELSSKIDQLSHSNSDMQNLMDATQIATIFLDRELRISRFTPAALPLFNLRPGDVGRPLSDMNTPLEYPELGSDAQRVLERLVPIEREVGQPDGSWYLSRLVPYRTTEDRIGGVVLTFIDITERKQAEEVRRWLSAVVSSTNDAIISFALDGTILSWNRGAQRLFGYQPDETIGQPLRMLSLAEGRDQDSVIADIAAGRTVDNLQAVRRRKDGSDVHVSMTISPISDDDNVVLAGTAIVRDVTAERTAAEALRQSEERLRLIIESAVEYAIFSTDLGRRIVSWNSGAQRLLGFSEAEAIGQSGDVIFTREDRDAHAPEKEAQLARREGRASDERIHVRKDGSRFRGTGTMMLMRNPAGEPVGFVKILRDLTNLAPMPEN